MDESNDIIQLLDILYGMVTEAWSVPLGADKCIIERERAVEIINEIKANLPTEIAEARRLVGARDEFIGSAKREAEAIRKSSEEKARSMIEEQEIIRASRAKSAEMIASAEAKSKELRRVASEYVDQIMSQTEESISGALSTIQSAQKAFKTAAGAPRSKPKPNPEVKETPAQPKISSQPQQQQRVAQPQPQQESGRRLPPIEITQRDYSEDE